jgi:lipooligosaccharide transport system permease protein
VIGSLRVAEHNLTVYRHTWRGSVLVSFVSPVLYLTAMGVGLGSLIHRPPAAGAASYLAFLAPGLLAAAAMQTASVETTYPVLARILWDKTYFAMLSTPLNVGDLLGGELLWITVRLFLVSSIFFLVMLGFHTVTAAMGILAVPAAILTGLAFAAPIIAFTAMQRHDSSFSALQRFVIIPLFLLGGTFFPISKLPVIFQALAWLAPLSHGVALTRGLTTGTISAPFAAVHVGVLVLYVGGGIATAFLLLRRRLVT